MTLTCRKQKRKKKKAKCSFNTPVTRTAEHLNPKTMQSAIGIGIWQVWRVFFKSMSTERELFFFFLINACQHPVPHLASSTVPLLYSISLFTFGEHTEKQKTRTQQSPPSSHSQHVQHSLKVAEQI